MSGFLGIEIGGTKIQVHFGTGGGGIPRRWRGSVDPKDGAEGIRRQIESACARLTEGNPPLAAGVGFGGPVDWRRGTVRCSHHVGGWSGFELKSWLGSLLRCPVFVDNDANVAALGESWQGAGQGMSPVFYATLGSGVGGGLTVEGRIYHGGIPGESEFGHLRLDREGTIVEDRCSGWAVNRRILNAVRGEPDSVLARMVASEPGNEARHLGPALRAGDPMAGDILAETAGDLAFALSHVVHLFHPQILILGGGLSLLGERLNRAVEERLGGFVMEALHPIPPVVLSKLAEDAVPAGAMVLARLGTAER